MSYFKVKMQQMKFRAGAYGARQAP